MTDERYKAIMAEIGQPNSRSLLSALRQVANEVAQEVLAAERERWRAALAYAVSEADGWHDDCRSGPIESPEMDAVRALLRA